MDVYHKDIRDNIWLCLFGFVVSVCAVLLWTVDNITIKFIVGYPGIFGTIMGLPLFFSGLFGLCIRMNRFRRWRIAKEYRLKLRLKERARQMQISNLWPSSVGFLYSNVEYKDDRIIFSYSLRHHDSDPMQEFAPLSPIREIKRSIRIHSKGNE